MYDGYDTRFSIDVVVFRNSMSSPLYGGAPVYEGYDTRIPSGVSFLDRCLSSLVHLDWSLCFVTSWLGGYHC